jgi:hypothetical protein
VSSPLHYQFSQDELLSIFNQVIKAVNESDWTGPNRQEFYKKLETKIKDEYYFQPKEVTESIPITRET